MSESSREQESGLVPSFIASFDRLNELTADEILDPVAWQLVSGDADQFGCRHWRPAKVITDRACLEELYSRLPARFPPLFELLLLSYRWAEVDLRLYTLLANPPGPDLTGFFTQLSKDKALWNCLSRARYIQFGRGPDASYDPVCFDVRSRRKGGECRIVKIDHEEILCNDRIRVTAELAPSFRQLMLGTIAQADRR